MTQNSVNTFFYDLAETFKNLNQNDCKEDTKCAL